MPTYYDENGNPYLDSNGYPVAPPAGAYATTSSTADRIASTQAPTIQGTQPDPKPSYTTIGGVNVPNGDIEGQWNAWRLQNAQQGLQANQAAIGDLSRQSAGVGARTSNIRNGQSGIIQSQTNSDAGYEQQSRDLAAQLTNAGNSANAFDWNALSGYQGQMAGYTQSNNAYMGGLGNLYGQLAAPLQSQTSWAGDLSSQAAGAYADPSSIAAQNNAMGFLSGAMGGSLNYQSQGAQAYADPQAIAAQYQALNQLQGAAAGNLNVTSQAATAQADQNAIDMQSQGLSGLWGIANGNLDIMPWSADPKSWDELQGAKKQYQDVYGGSLDVKPGDLDPEAYAAQKDALSQYSALTTPKLTDAERFIYENERLNAERDERSNREATASGLRQRGMGGSGMELVNSSMANQQVSQNRLLGDLGANAQAINRSMQALQGYGGLSSTMNDQANALGTANANRRTNALGGYSGIVQGEQSLASQMAQANRNRSAQAMGMYTDQTGRLRSQTFDEALARGTAADQVAMTNMNRELQAMGMSADTAGNIRNSSFNEAYSRGIAADNASANNQQTQLQGGIAYGNMANTQRSQSFNEAYSRGTAADQTAQFNRQQSIGVSEWNDQFNQNERDAQWNRGLGYTQTGLRTNELNAANDSRSYDAGQTVNQNTFGRTAMGIGAQDTAATRAHDDSRYTNGLQFDLGNQLVGDENSAFGRQAGITGLGISSNNAGIGAINDIGSSFAGQAAAVTAGTAAERAAALAEKNNPGGLLGTGILGKHDPLNPGNWFRGSIK